MKQFVPLRKQSKKARRAYHAALRGCWYGISPVTQVVPSCKAYNRNRRKQADRKAAAAET